MAYSAFNLARVQADFGITVQTSVDLFGHIPAAVRRDGCGRALRNDVACGIEPRPEGSGPATFACRRPRSLPVAQ